MDELRVAVIVGSTREGRVGPGIGRWFTDLAARRADLGVSTVDLADFRFPDRYPAAPDRAVRRFGALLGAAEAFVVVTPEYNRSFPASLKQAVDLAYEEWRAKPVGFVSYGCGSRGGYAVEHLRGVFTELHAMPVRDRVGIDLLDGPPGERAEADTARLLDQLAWWGLALREARACRAYPI